MPLTTIPDPDRIVSFSELQRRSSLSRATLYRLMPDELDRPKKISPGRVGWQNRYVSTWLAERMGEASA